MVGIDTHLITIVKQKAYLHEKVLKNIGERKVEPRYSYLRNANLGTFPDIPYRGFFYAVKESLKRERREDCREHYFNGTKAQEKLERVKEAIRFRELNEKNYNDLFEGRIPFFTTDREGMVINGWYHKPSFFRPVIEYYFNKKRFKKGKKAYKRKLTILGLSKTPIKVKPRAVFVT